MKIILNKNKLSNFDYCTQTEWMEINQLGSYSASTVYGLNSRRRHGLFNVSSDDCKQRMNLLSKFEETVFIKDYSFELSTNQYIHAIYPAGYQLLEKFTRDPFPKFTYLVSGRRIEKTIILIHNQNLLIVRYALKNAGLPVKLVLKPIIGGRYTHELVHNIQGINVDSYLEENIVKIAPRANIPELKIFFTKGEYISAPLWYHDFIYKNDIYVNDSKEKQKEDLLNPGFFTCDLNPYETLDLFIYVDKCLNHNFEELYRKEREYRNRTKSVINKFPAFIRDISKRVEIIPVLNAKKTKLCCPDYYKSEFNIRECILSLFGSLIVKDKTTIKKIINLLIQNIENGLFYSHNSNNNGKHTFADASLLFIKLGYHFYRLYKDDKFLEETMFGPFSEIIESYRKGTNFNIYMDKDNLIFSGSNENNTSFIPFNSENGQVQRYGKLLEVNSNWIDAINIMKYFSQQLNKKRLVKKYGKLVETATSNFLDQFWDEDHGKFYDFIRNDIKDNTFRINQISVLALSFPILDLKNGRRLMRKINKELLTPYGLRSLSNKDANYISKREPEQNKSDLEYFNGAVFPWSIGEYITANVKYKTNNKAGYEDLNKLLLNFENLYKTGCMGYFSQFIQGEEPFLPEGQSAFFLNMTELLRGAFYLHMIDKKSKKKVQ